MAPVPSEMSLGDQTVRGVRWMSLARLIAESGALVGSIVLARLVSPAEFGLTAAGMFVFTLALAVSQQGMGAFLVQRKDPLREHFEAAMLGSVGIGLLGSALTAAFGWLLAPMLFGDHAAHLTVLAAPVFLLAALATVPMAQLQRRLDFARLGVIEASSSIVAPAVSIVLAAGFGLGGESIIGGALAASGLTTVFAWTLSRPPRPWLHRAQLREIVDFGLPASGSSVFFAAVRNIDYLLLAAFIPARQVGLYMRAFTLGSDYQSKISVILLNVSFPILSRAKDLEEVRRVRQRMVRVHATVLFPLLFGLIAVAPTFVPWLYGARWAEAGHLTQILAIGGMVAAVGTGTGPLLTATGHPRALLAYNVIGFFAYAAAVLIAVPFGVVAVCIAVVAVRIVSFVVLQYAVVQRRVGIPVLETVIEDVLPPIVAGIPLLLVTAGGLRVLTDAGVPPLPAMALPGLLGLAVYLRMLTRFFPATMSDIRRLVGRLGIRPRRRPGRPALSSSS
jgi:O-antigen/teichoic acid export membrane protein